MYRIKGFTSDGTSFDLEQTFEDVSDAIAYAEGYAHAVGSVSLVNHSDALLRARKQPSEYHPDGYWEDIYIVREV